MIDSLTEGEGKLEGGPQTVRPHIIRLQACNVVEIWRQKSLCHTVDCRGPGKDGVGSLAVGLGTRMGEPG